MHVKVLFFGQLKDITGFAEDALDAPDGAPLASIFEHYATLFPRMQELKASIVMALNRQFADASVEAQDGDEVAFLPPVSGGSRIAMPSPYIHEIADESGSFYALTRGVIDIDRIKRRLLAGTDGAIVVFEGVVRNNTKGRPTRFLDYECYETMAIEVMAVLGREIAASHPVGRIALVHRLGRMDIGEASVVVAVTAPHRRPAFDAALEGINRLKKTVPIWKKEYFADGEVWVEGEWDDSVPKT